MRLFYGQTLTLMPEGYSFRNARRFERIEIADAVMIDGDWPEILAAYTAAGVTVVAPFNDKGVLALSVGGVDLSEPRCETGKQLLKRKGRVIPRLTTPDNIVLD